MKKPTIYIETSIFGFYYDDRPENKTKMQTTRKLFKEIKEGRFYAVTSPLSITELSRIPETYKETLLNLVKNYGVEVVNVDEEEFTI